MLSIFVTGYFAQDTNRSHLLLDGLENGSFLVRCFDRLIQLLICQLACQLLLLLLLVDIALISKRLIVLSRFP